MENEDKPEFEKYFKPNILLSADELVRQFKAANKTIPSKGGTKDFQPDGSWLQGKKLDMIYSTKESLLAEQRADKLGSILIGEWDREKNLVEYKKDARKFWSKMGFVDEKRKWLYPEEALFLMETNALLVFNDKVPLSIQQGYRVFLGNSISRIQYQVYAHLRRIGYIVVRFQNNSDFTSYEMNMKLHQYVKKKRKFHTDDHDSSSEEECLEETKKSPELNQAKKIRSADPVNKCLEKEEEAELEPEEKDQALNVEPQYSNVHSNQKESVYSDENSSKNSEIGICSEIKQQSDLVCVKKRSESNNIEMKDNDSVQMIEGCTNGEVTQNIQSLTIENDNKTNLKELDSTEDPTQEHLITENVGISKNEDDSKKVDSAGVKIYSNWDFDEYNIPNIGNQMFVNVKPPDDSIVTPLLGKSIQPIEHTFNVQEYRETVMCQNKYFRSTQNNAVKNKPLKYSLRKVKGEAGKSAKNWSEYKVILEREKIEEEQALSSAKLLWEDDIKPLLSPDDCLSTDEALQKLQIIQNAQLHCKGKDNSSNTSGDWNIIFDVYQPNSQFKKTNPGLPYFRVCVCRFDDNPPSLADYIHLTNSLKDQVPINWAFVDNGEVAFYTFQGFTIPKESLS
ncbi:tRNA-splicing endonuclease subunit Sen54-like [Argonauta hians]